MSKNAVAPLAGPVPGAASYNEGSAPPPYPQQTGSGAYQPVAYQSAAYPSGYPQQPPPAYGQQQSTTAVVITQPQVYGIQRFHDAPIRHKCQYCQADIVTSTNYTVGTFTWVACFIIAWIIPLGCCFIPFCMNGCKDVEHDCPNCKQQVGKFNRM